MESCKFGPHRSATSGDKNQLGPWVGRSHPDSGPPWPPWHKCVRPCWAVCRWVWAQLVHSPPTTCPHLGVVSVLTGSHVPRESGPSPKPTPHGQAGEGEGPQRVAGRGGGAVRGNPISCHRWRTDPGCRWPPALRTAAWPQWPWSTPPVSAAALLWGLQGAGSRTCSATPESREQSEARRWRAQPHKKSCLPLR